MRDAPLFLPIAVLALTAVALADSFDVPVQTKVVDFGPSPHYPNPQTAPHTKLSCYTFPTFMVKEYDDGQKCAEWLSIAPSAKGAALACSTSHGTDEIVIDEGWWYFEGVKGDLVFFRAADGNHGGLTFRIYDANTGKQVFEDSPEAVEEAPFNHLEFGRAPDGQLVLKYRRVVDGDCKLLSDKGCWERTRRKFGLKTARMPVCTGDPDCESGHCPFSASESWWHLSYPVEVTLFPQPVIRAIVGPVTCGANE